MQRWLAPQKTDFKSDTKCHDFVISLLLLALISFFHFTFLSILYKNALGGKTNPIFFASGSYSRTVEWKHGFTFQENETLQRSRVSVRYDLKNFDEI